MILQNKKALAASFSWIFSIIAGAAILFLALYLVSQLSGTGQEYVDTKKAKELSIIFEPLETGLASIKSGKVSLREETKIITQCNTYGSWGNSNIQISTKSGIGESWKKPSDPFPIPNKYIFSDEIEQGETLYVASKPFKMPFKVSEMIFLMSENYCFINAPDEIKQEIGNFNLQNLETETENCTEKDVKVCFGYGSSDCDIEIYGSCTGYNCNTEYDFGTFIRNETEQYYAGNLLYAGIFSDAEIYDCNLKRLMLRLGFLADLYSDEANFISQRCGTISALSLQSLASAAESYSVSENLLLIREIAGQLDNENSGKQCSLW